MPFRAIPAPTTTETSVHLRGRRTERLFALRGSATVTEFRCKFSEQRRGQHVKLEITWDDAPSPQAPGQGVCLPSMSWLGPQTRWASVFHDLEHAVKSHKVSSRLLSAATPLNRVVQNTGCPLQPPQASILAVGRYTDRGLLWGVPRPPPLHMPPRLCPLPANPCPPPPYPPCPAPVSPLWACRAAPLRLELRHRGLRPPDRIPLHHAAHALQEQRHGAAARGARGGTDGAHVPDHCL